MTDGCHTSNYLKTLQQDSVAVGGLSDDMETDKL